MINRSNVLAISHISEDSLSTYIAEVNRFASLSQEEEFLLAKNYLEKNDLKAAHALVQSHLKLVVKIAMSYKNYGLPLMDLISEGNIGLMTAVKKYNPDLGFRLSTYSLWWIKANIQEYILRSWSLVKIGTTSAQKKLFFGLNKIKRKLSNYKLRKITDDDFDEIADEIGVSVKEVANMNVRMSGSDISLNTKISDNTGSSELIDLIPNSSTSHEIILSTREESTKRHQLLTNALSTLNARESDIIKSRKLNETPLTLDQLSVKHEVSKERVRQIENKALEKIKNYILANIPPPEVSC